jgi:hypothetical protein
VRRTECEEEEAAVRGDWSRIAEKCEVKRRKKVTQNCSVLKT